MASLASSTPTCGARKPAWTKTIGQLHFRPPPQVAHTSRLDQFIFLEGGCVEQLKTRQTEFCLPS